MRLLEPGDTVGIVFNGIGRTVLYAGVPTGTTFTGTLTLQRRSPWPEVTSDGGWIDTSQVWDGTAGVTKFLEKGVYLSTGVDYRIRASAAGALAWSDTVITRCAR